MNLSRVVADVMVGRSVILISISVGMAVYMGGGSLLMYAADAIAAYEQLQQQASIAA
jgi:hypothetical protein